MLHRTVIFLAVEVFLYILRGLILATSEVEKN